MSALGLASQLYNLDGQVCELLWCFYPTNESLHAVQIVLAPHLVVKVSHCQLPPGIITQAVNDMHLYQSSKRAACLP